MNEIEQKLVMILYECNQHKKMIENSYALMESYLPLTEKSYKNFSIEEIGNIDKFLFRFSKLQDSMGEKLFSTLLFLLGEEYSKKPFIDMLNRLETMELLYKQEWLDLRTIRNNVFHEYSFNIDELVDSLNEIYATTDKILTVYETFYDYCFEKFDFIRESEVLH